MQIPPAKDERNERGCALECYSCSHLKPSQPTEAIRFDPLNGDGGSRCRLACREIGSSSGTRSGRPCWRMSPRPTYHSSHWRRSRMSGLSLRATHKEPASYPCPRLPGDPLTKPQIANPINVTAMMGVSTPNLAPTDLPTTYTPNRQMPPTRTSAQSTDRVAGLGPAPRPHFHQAAKVIELKITPMIRMVTRFTANGTPSRYSITAVAANTPFPIRKATPGYFAMKVIGMV